MNEAQYRSRIVKFLRPYDAVPVENPVCAGTPDVNCSLGWIELKVDKWVGGHRVLRLSHFTPQQQLWLLKRSTCGGMAVLLVHVESGEDILLNGHQAFTCAGRTRDWFANPLNVEGWWPDGVSAQELLDKLESIHGRMNTEPIDDAGWAVGPD